MKKKIKWYNYRAYSDRNINLKKNAEAGERWKERHPEVIEKINKITVPKSHLNYFFKKDNYKYLGIYILIMSISFTLSTLSVYFIDYGYSIVGAMSTACILADFNKRGNKNKLFRIFSENDKKFYRRSV